MLASRTRTRSLNALWPALALIACRASSSDATVASAVEAVEPPRPTLEALMPGQFGEQYFGVLASGKKIGYSSTSTIHDTRSGCYEVRNDFALQFESEGQRSTLTSHELRRYAPEPPHRLLVAESTSVEDGVVMARLLARDERGWTLKTIEAGQASSMAIDHVNEDLEQSFRGARAAIDGEPPFECRVDGFDLDLGQGRSTRLRAMGEVLQQTAMGPLKARRVEALKDGDDAPIDALYDTTGRTIGGNLPGLVEFVAMDEAAARAPGGALDSLADLSIPVTGLSGRSEDVTKLRLEWSGVGELLPERDFQHARWLHEGEVQELVLERVRAPSADELSAAIPSELAPDLAAEPSCESDHPRIRELAAKITAGAADPWAKTRAVVHWVDGELADTYNSNRSTALGTLEAKAGDCTEHTLLACALLRASGIPARRVGGVMFMGGAEKAFANHAWVEVWIGRWIPVDPTWDEAPVDATHVYYGDEQAFRFLVATGMSARAIAVERE